MLFLNRFFLLIPAIATITIATELNPATAASFEGLGFVAEQLNTSKYEYSGVSLSDLSADGSMAVGTFSWFDTTTSYEGYESFFWNRNTNEVSFVKDLTENPLYGNAYRISADGSTIVGHTVESNGESGFIWDREAGIADIGTLYDQGYFLSPPRDLSADGSTVVGVSADWEITGIVEAFIWNREDGIQGLGSYFADSLYNVANGVSEDGSIIVGTRNIDSDNFFSQDPLVLNRNNDSVTIIQGDESFIPDNASNISSDGSTVIGQGYAIDPDSGRLFSGREAFVWNEALGLQRLGDFAGGDIDSSANGISADGSMIVGTGETDTGDLAFIWDAASGMRSLKDVLEQDYNLDLTGWTLESATNISDDGSTIIGSGINPNGIGESWIATLSNNAAPVPESSTLWGLALASLGIVVKNVGS